MCSWDGMQSTRLTAVPMPAETIVSPSRVPSILAAFQRRNTELRRIADSYNYDCLTPKLTAKVAPLFAMSTTVCLNASTTISMRGTPCKDQCTAPLPPAFYYLSGGVDGLGDSWQTVGMVAPLPDSNATTAAPNVSSKALNASSSGNTTLADGVAPELDGISPFRGRCDSLAG